MNAGMHCRVATEFSTVVACSDFTGFSSDDFKRKVVKPSNRSNDSKSEINVTMWLISVHVRRVQGYIHCRYCVSEYTGKNRYVAVSDRNSVVYFERITEFDAP